MRCAGANAEEWYRTIVNIHRWYKNQIKISPVDKISL